MKKILAIVNDGFSVIMPHEQLLVISNAINDVTPIQARYLVLDDLGDVNKVALAAHSENAVSVVCSRLADIFHLAPSFHALVEFISELQKQGLGFIAVREKINTEDSLPDFLHSLSQGWTKSRADYKRENPKVSQMKARMNGSKLGRRYAEPDSKIIELRNEGETIRMISKKTGHSVRTVMKVLRQAQATA